jgi:glutathione S-transferase
MSEEAHPILYGYFRSTAAYRVRIAVNLKRIAVQHRHVHLRKGEQNEAQFRKVNGAGRLQGISGPFAFGERPTLADICIVPQVFNARRFGVDLEPYRRIREIEAAASTAEAFVAARPERQADAE